MDIPILCSVSIALGWDVYYDALWHMGIHCNVCQNVLCLFLPLYLIFINDNRVFYFTVMPSIGSVIPTLSHGFVYYKESAVRSAQPHSKAQPINTKQQRSNMWPCEVNMQLVICSTWPNWCLSKHHIGKAGGKWWNHQLLQRLSLTFCCLYNCDDKVASINKVTLTQEPNLLELFFFNLSRNNTFSAWESRLMSRCF